MFNVSTYLENIRRSIPFNIQTATLYPVQMCRCCFPGVGIHIQQLHSKSKIGALWSFVDNSRLKVTSEAGR